jgi:hypothetical protein
LKLTQLSKLKNPDVVDKVIYQKNRLWRLLGSRHKVTNLFKTQITPRELFDLPMKQIKEYAEIYHKPIYTDRSGLIPKWKAGMVEKAMELYDEITVRDRKPHYVAVDDPDDSKTLDEIFCRGRMIMYHRQVPRGRRNQSGLILASAMRQGGYSKDKTEKILQGWNTANGIGLDENQIGNIVKSAYKKETPYSFGCKSLEHYCPYKNWSDCEDYNLHRFFDIDD